MKISVFAPPWGPTATARDMAAVVEAAETLGYASMWVGDHLVFPRAVGSTYLYNTSGVSPFDPDQPLLDPITLVAWLAGQTSRIALGISVLVLPIRNPVETAKHLADIAVLSGGRLSLGVGAGWMKEEFDTLGADHANRGKITDEWIDIFRHLWSGSAAPFDGEFYQFGSLGFEPRPPALPIVVGGNSTVALRRAARNEGWHGIRMSSDELRAKVNELRGFVQERGDSVKPYAVVYRGSLVPLGSTSKSASRELLGTVISTLRAFETAGTTEFIIEWPDASTADRIAWMRWLADNEVVNSDGSFGRHARGTE